MFRVCEFGVKTGEWSRRMYDYGEFFEFGLCNSSICPRIKHNDPNEEIIMKPVTVSEDYDFLGTCRIRDFEYKGFNDGTFRKDWVIYADPQSLNMRMSVLGRYDGESLQYHDTYFLVFPKRFEMIRYSTRYDICSTFRLKEIAIGGNKKEKIYGCYLNAPEHPEPGQESLIRIQGRVRAKDGRGFVYVHCELKMGEDGVQMIVNTISNTKTIKTLEKLKKNCKQFFGFKPLDRGIRTSIVIVPHPEQRSKELRDMGKLQDLINSAQYKLGVDLDPQSTGENDIHLFVLSKDSTAEKWSDDDVTALNALMFDYKPKMRALTILDQNIPADVMKKLHPLYVFKMDETGKVTCTRSN